MIAVIDVGSNGIRLALGEVSSQGKLKFQSSFRAPVRLGSDSFSKGRIGDKALGKVISAFHEFKDIMSQEGVSEYKVVATSAIREASNGEELIKKIFAQTQLRVDMIDDREEARLIHRAVSHEIELNKKKALLMDIGGGSVEVIYSRSSKIKDFIGLRLGTVRLMEKYEGPYFGENYLRFLSRKVKLGLNPLNHLVKEVTSNGNCILVGTGGNVRALKKMAKEEFAAKDQSSLTREHLQRLISILFAYEYPQRLTRLGLRKDRADVILPAAVLIHEMMKKFDFSEIAIPQAGLKDGVLLEMADG